MYRISNPSVKPNSYSPMRRVKYSPPATPKRTTPMRTPTRSRKSRRTPCRELGDSFGMRSNRSSAYSKSPVRTSSVKSSIITGR